MKERPDPAPPGCTQVFFCAFAVYALFSCLVLHHSSSEHHLNGLSDPEQMGCGGGGGVGGRVGVDYTARVELPEPFTNRHIT